MNSMSLGEDEGDRGSTLPSSPLTSVKSKSSMEDKEESSDVLKEVGSKCSDMFTQR